MQGNPLSYQKLRMGQAMRRLAREQLAELEGSG